MSSHAQNITNTAAMSSGSAFGGNRNPEVTEVGYHILVNAVRHAFAVGDLDMDGVREAYDLALSRDLVAA